MTTKDHIAVLWKLAGELKEKNNDEYADSVIFAIEHLEKAQKYKKKAKRYKRKWLSLRDSLRITKELTTGIHNEKNDGLYTDALIIDPSNGYNCQNSRGVQSGTSIIYN